MSGTSSHPYAAMELPSWEFRHTVTAAMLNPALVGAVLAGSAERYEFVSGEAMPWEYSFLIAPLVFHRETRHSLPNRIDSHLTKWISENPVLVTGFPARAREMRPYVREGLRFALRTSSLSLLADGTLTGTIRPSKARLASPELKEFIASAGFVGRWLTNVDRPVSAFQLFGVAP